jgi:type VI secretion system secreted protein VgrG
MALVQSPRIATLQSPLGGDVLVFESLSATEQLGRLFSLEITAQSEKGDIKADDLLGKGVSVELKCPRGGTRCFHGFVNRFSRIPRPGKRYFAYHLAAVPWLWFLTRHSDCRIYQNKTLQDILRDVFQRRGFSDFKFNLSGNYTPWEYCVQYRETDFNFISRMLEQEGVYYFFEHSKDKHTAVFADSPSAHQPFPKYENLTFRALESFHEHDDEHIYEWTVEGRHRSGKYLHTDYDFTRPKADLKAPTSMPGKFAKSDIEIFDYPGEYDKHNDGDQWSRIRMEELSSDEETFDGGGDVTGLACGYKFNLSEPPSSGDAGTYVLTGTSIQLQSNIYETGIEGAEESYHCAFTAIKSSHQFRPARLTPKPHVQGIQTAVVTGPKGEEIYTDKYGRIKVQFFWDREGKHDENTTCFIRVAEAWSGKNWGSVFTPRIGQEVVVAFLEGDPDQPLVIGSVYNGEQVPPYELPTHKTVSAVKSRSSLSGSAQNFNEIRFEDKKGQEQVFINAEKDMDLRVENDSREIVQHDRHLIVESNQIEWVKKDKHAHVQGKFNERVDGDLSLQVGSKRQEKIGTVDTVEAGLEIHLKAGMKVIIEAGAQISLVGPGGFVDISPAGVTIQGTMVLINSGGAPGSGTESSPESPKDPDTADDGSKRTKLN